MGQTLGQAVIEDASTDQEYLDALAAIGVTSEQAAASQFCRRRNRDVGERIRTVTGPHCVFE